MVTSRRNPIIALGLAAAAVAAGCSSHKDLETARSSVYDIDFAIVYSEAMAAVQQLYPTTDDDPTRGVIRTAWHAVPLAQTSSDDPTRASSLGTGGAGGPTAQTTGAMPTGQPTVADEATLGKKYFVRFDVSVLGGRPWRVHVIGHASEWVPGNALPTELSGANVPHWLAGRTDELVVAIYRRLQTYARPAPAAPTRAAPADEVKVDVAAFGAIPPAAAKVLAGIEKAVELRDYAAMRGAVADDVTWSLGAAPGADVAMATWQADPSALDALVAALKAGCAADGGKVTCPAAAARPGYAGWRATFETRGPAWKLTSFLRAE